MIRQVVDDDGSAMLAEIAYDAFGNISSTLTPDTADVIFGFTGREYDAETGLNYHRRRYYDPDTGRWLSEDPIGTADDANLYRYVGNYATGGTDPTGLYFSSVSFTGGNSLLPSGFGSLGSSTFDTGSAGGGFGIDASYVDPFFGGTDAALSAAASGIDWAQSGVTSIGDSIVGGAQSFQDRFITTSAAAHRSDTASIFSVYGQVLQQTYFTGVAEGSVGYFLDGAAQTVLGVADAALRLGPPRVAPARPGDVGRREART